VVIPCCTHARHIGRRGQEPAGGKKAIAPPIHAGLQWHIRERKPDNWECCESLCASLYDGKYIEEFVSHLARGRFMIFEGKTLEKRRWRKDVGEKTSVKGKTGGRRGGNGVAYSRRGREQNRVGVDGLHVDPETRGDLDM
jgi:hypothetical protein